METSIFKRDGEIWTRFKIPVQPGGNRMKYKPWREMTEQEIYKLKKNQCCKCHYSYGMNAGKAGGLCDYLCMEGHSRGCSPLLCKEKGIYKPKRGRKKKKGVRPIV